MCIRDRTYTHLPAPLRVYPVQNQKAGFSSLYNHLSRFLLHWSNYKASRKNGYTMFPAGPSREYLNRGVFLMRENIPCALYALEVTDEAYIRAKRRTQHMMHHGELYRFNSLGLLLCWMHIRWQRRRHYFCSQFVSEVLQKSGALDLPKPSTLMHPSDYAELPQLRCLYRGTLADLPQRQSMEMGEVESVMGLYLSVLLGAVRGGVRHLF